MIPAKFISERLIVCAIGTLKDILETPSGSFNLLVGLSLNKIEKPVHNLKFHVLGEFSLQNILPSSGSELGNTSIVLFGKGFLNTEIIYCVFEDLFIEAKIISKDQLVCLTPKATDKRQISVRVSLNNKYLSNNLIYTYIALPTVTGISPRWGTIGGNSKVFLSGTGFDASSQISCGFGDTVVPTLVENDHTLSCLTPTSLQSGEVKVVCFNDVGDTLGSVDFMYIQQLHVESITPSRIFVNSTNINITVNGEFDFFFLSKQVEHIEQSELAVSCQFGKSVVSAQVVSRNELRCIAPTSTVLGPVDFLIASGSEVLSLSSFAFYYDGNKN
jgi:hypothetical protein